MGNFKNRLREKAKSQIDVCAVDIESMDDETMKQLFEELQIYQVELEIQNEELRNAQQAMEETKIHYKSLFDNAPIGYVILDHSGMILQYNIAFEEIFGNRGNVVHSGTPFSNLLVDTDAYLFRSRFKALVKHPDGKVMTYRLIGNQRNIHHIQIKAKSHDTPFFRSNQDANELLLMITDITELKVEQQKTEEALKETQRREQEVQALLQGARAVLLQADFQTTARKIFDICCTVIGSQSGYVALLSDDGEENEVLFLEDGGFPCSVDPNLPMPIRGLRETAYRTNKTVYDNTFMDSEWAMLMPEGHVRLENVMFAPLVIEGKTVGIMGLANKNGDFTERDAYIAHGFGKMCAIALHNSWNLEKRDQSEAKNRELILELKDALDNIKQLKGLLPICSHCKKIRDDQGYWKQIEGYIQEHSDAVFSHSICRECAKIHYPDFDIYGDE